jgi:hypothetical protein
MEKSLWSFNMKVRAITTWNNRLYKEYAYRFEESYNLHWSHIPLTVYNEDVNLFKLIPECYYFIEKNKHRPHKDFLRDACRFSYKVYSYTHAILNDNDSDFIIGIDADSVFYKPINNTWIKNNIFREDCMMTYLGRGNQYSECGFLGFNMKHPYTKRYAKEMQNMYTEEKLFKLIEWHDSYIWDHVRIKFESEYGVTNLNIGDGGNGHVQARSCLGPIYDHTKGPNRKVEGFSGENNNLRGKRGKYND